jgi:hypothetical protein
MKIILDSLLEYNDEFTAQEPDSMVSNNTNIEIIV